jgi:acetyl-CoA carboxylase biotin carboxyl carrier protein
MKFCNEQLETIKKLMQLCREFNLSAFEWKEEDRSIYLSWSSSTTPNLTTPSMEMQQEKTASASLTTDEVYTIRSPMVGTAYLAPHPEAKPFVEIGQAVNAGDVLCIVEAMKMMHPITADKSGTIKACLIDNAAPVEYNQPLFVIDN